MNKYSLYIEHRDTETQRSCAKTKNSVPLVGRICNLLGRICNPTAWNIRIYNPRKIC